MAMLLSECRMLYENRNLCETLLSKIEKEIKDNHTELKKKSQFQKVKECVDDILALLNIDQ